MTIRINHNLNTIWDSSWVIYMTLITATTMTVHMIQVITNTKTTATWTMT